MIVILSFACFLALFVGIGIYSSTRAKKTTSDYLLAGRSMSPWLVALSAVSTNNSGYMFIGQIGYTYLKGLSSIWIMIGWILGDFIASMIVHQKLRTVSGTKKFMSFGELIASWNGRENQPVRILVGAITVIFLCLYAAAQFKAGSKALHVLFGWDIAVGSIIGALIVFAYCIAGGIRASIWTDAAQSIVMIFSMGLLVYFAYAATPGWNSAIASMDAISPQFLSLFPDGGFSIAALLFIVGWLFAGFGVIGQPHIMIRFMTLDDPKNMNRTRFFYYSWFIAFYILAICVGLFARLLIPPASGFDPEMALPTLSTQLLPEILIGVMLAGIFSATMSTADSQIISCTASVSRDLTKKGYFHGYWGTKFTTFAVTLVALFFALFGPDSVFHLVLMAWSALGSAFGPILFLYAIGRKITETELLFMILGGGSMAFLWQGVGWSSVIYEMAPGMLFSLLIYLIFRATKSQKQRKAKANGI